MARNYKQGQFVPINKEKYKGKNCPRYLSSWEEYFMKWCDRNPMVIEWSSENVIVPYHNPTKVTKGLNSRYMVDIYMKYKDRKGVIHECLCEIKPYGQTLAPKRGRKKKSTYDQEMSTYIVNQAKWAAAMKYADERNWDFKIITENSIFKG